MHESTILISARSDYVSFQSSSVSRLGPVPLSHKVLNLVGYVFAVVTFGFFNATVYQKEAIRTNGRPAPELLFYGAMFGCWLVPIGLFVSLTTT